MKTVLIIEDNQDSMVLITRFLEKFGYKTLKACTGMEGFEMALRIKPDFIILDIQLPDMDGIEVLKKIRSSPTCSNILVIAVTSYAMAGDKERLLAAGCNGYIEKPIDPEHFISQLRQLTEKR
jgi:CheY-like chemotaxis protein